MKRSKVLDRPMFNPDPSKGTGITSGLTARAPFNQGGRVGLWKGAMTDMILPSNLGRGYYPLSQEQLAEMYDVEKYPWTSQEQGDTPEYHTLNFLESGLEQTNKPGKSKKKEIVIGDFDEIEGHTAKGDTVLTDAVLTTGEEKSGKKGRTDKEFTEGAEEEYELPTDKIMTDDEEYDALMEKYMNRVRDKKADWFSIAKAAAKGAKDPGGLMSGIATGLESAAGDIGKARADDRKAAAKYATAIELQREKNKSRSHQGFKDVIFYDKIKEKFRNTMNRDDFKSDEEFEAALDKKTRTYLKGTSYDDQMIIKSVGEDFGAIGVQAFMQGITPDKMIKRTGESLTSVRDALMKDTTLEKGETYVVKITTPKGSTVITWTK